MSASIILKDSLHFSIPGFCKGKFMHKLKIGATMNAISTLIPIPLIPMLLNDLMPILIKV